MFRANKSGPVLDQVGAGEATKELGTICPLRCMPPIMMAKNAACADWRQRRTPGQLATIGETKMAKTASANSTAKIVLDRPPMFVL